MRFKNYCLKDELIEKFRKELVSDADELLLNFVFQASHTQEELDSFLSNWDITVVQDHALLMFAYFMKAHNELVYSEEVKNITNKLLVAYRFHNLKLISHFKKIGKALTDENINILVLKGGAMRAINSENPRLMGDIDALVPVKDYEKSEEIAKKLGYYVSYSKHSIDLHTDKDSEDGIMDIHKYICMETPNEEAYVEPVFKRAIHKDVFGIDAFLPSIEDMYFITLTNLVRNLANKTSSKNIMFAMYDCVYLLNLKPDFDWNIVIENAKLTNTTMQICFGTEFLNRIVPNVVPDKIVRTKELNKQIEDYATLVMFNRFYLMNLRATCQEIKIDEAFKSLHSIKEYISLKPQYFFMKRKGIRKNPKNAGLAIQWLKRRKYGYKYF